ncbi:MAG: hypothetical protein PHO37_03200 [Kiritimatiellae bacterium]|nr:hypothetical protein [Kiritimatiellia bacterium]
MKICQSTVPKAVLLALAGGLWMCVSAMLLSLAGGWLRECSVSERFVFCGAGVTVALLIYHLAFVRIVEKNLKRILVGENQRCLFSFMPWSSYLVIPVMITLGVVLRHSSLPKRYLASLYIGVGLALLWSSMRYLRVFIREHRGTARRG